MHIPILKSLQNSFANRLDSAQLFLRVSLRFIALYFARYSSAAEINAAARIGGAIHRRRGQGCAHFSPDMRGLTTLTAAQVLQTLFGQEPH
jgi:hypothetical protein